jgi:hypothetical protein
VSRAGAFVTRVAAPARTAGVTVGSRITQLAGHLVSSARGLGRLTSALLVGRAVSISWRDARGRVHRGSVTPVAGPTA